MTGTKERAFGPLPPVSLADRVPTDNFYRHPDRTLDLSFIRDLVSDNYAGIGRPSVDPVVLFKLRLVRFFEGLRSERQRLRTVADRLSLRWYLGDDLTEPLPGHSSLTRIGDRYGLQVFRRFAAAALRQHGRGCWPRPDGRGAAGGRCGSPRLDRGPTASFRRTADFRVSLTDPDASPIPRATGRTQLGYQDHYLVAGGKSRIIHFQHAGPFPRHPAARDTTRADAGCVQTDNGTEARRGIAGGWPAGRSDGRLFGRVSLANPTASAMLYPNRRSAYVREGAWASGCPSGRRAHRAYLAVPERGSGPGVLVLHAWWGLTPVFTEVCDRLAAAGYVALAPGLFPGGATAATIAEAEALLGALDEAAVAEPVVRAATEQLRGLPAVTGATDRGHRLLAGRLLGAASVAGAAGRRRRGRGLLRDG